MNCLVLQWNTMEVLPFQASVKLGAIFDVIVFFNLFTKQCADF